MATAYPHDPSEKQSEESLRIVIVEQFVSCSICLKEYKKLIDLPCTHTFCKGCLMSHFTDLIPGKEFSCPLCRKKTKVPEDGLDGFTHNFFIESLQDTVRKKGHDKKCRYCKVVYQTVNRATSKCITCHDYLCKQCSHLHCETNHAKDHRVLTFEQLRGGEYQKEIQDQQTIFCLEHEDESIRYFCTKCDTPICRDCRDLHHDGHKLISLEQAAEAVKPQLEIKLHVLQKIYDIDLENEEKTIESLATLQENENSIKQKIIARAARMHQLVDENEKELLRELHQTAITHRESLRAFSEKCSIHSDTIKQTTSVVKEALERGAPLDVIMVQQQYGQRLDDLQNKSHVDGMPEIRQITLRTNYDIDKWIPSGDGCSIDTSTSVTVGTNTPTEETDTAVYSTGSSVELHNFHFVYDQSSDSGTSLSIDEDEASPADSWTKSIGDSLETTALISAEDTDNAAKANKPGTIPVELKEDLLRFSFVDMFGVCKEGFQVYVCSMHFGKHTASEVKQIITRLVNAHGLDCDVIVTSAPQRLSLNCGKKPTRPGAKVVRDGDDEEKFGSLGGYIRTNEPNSPIYVLTNEHVAGKKGGRYKVIRSCQTGPENSCEDVHCGICCWAIPSGDEPCSNRYVDIAAIKIQSLGLREGQAGQQVVAHLDVGVFHGEIGDICDKLVFKYGAETSLTYGNIKAWDVVLRDFNDTVFDGLMLVIGQTGHRFAEKGDSGSILRLEDGRQAVAMIIGGNVKWRSGQGEHALASGVACFPLNAGIKELERVSGNRWFLEDEDNLKCLLPNQCLDLC